MNTMDFIGLTAVVVSLVVAGLLVYGYKKGMMKQADLTNIGVLIDTATTMLKGLDKKNSVVTMFATYAAKAVHVVEQLVKNGELEKDNELRKNMAHQTVTQLALADGVDVDVLTKNEDVIDVLIEAAVNEMQQDQLDVNINPETLEVEAAVEDDG